ncbi:MAG: HAMP domain-containing histidine kinase [Lachnospiraceae bacterium]|nr:HAMP domain-containing histidine kinase [Lachnospiraceae bacterium]
MKFGQYLKEHKGSLILFVVCAGIYFITFVLYHFPLQAVLYPTYLCALILLGYFFSRYRQAKKKHEDFALLQKLPETLLESMQQWQTTEDADYQEILRLLAEARYRENQENHERFSDAMEYFTTWAHQIKTPIASMRLRLEAEDSTFARGVSEDLFRIESYVEMVLTYLRLGEGGSDYVFRGVELDDVIKGSLRKYASQFIGHGVRLIYEPVDMKVITDEKWFSFVLEQLLSNALKYTPAGSVTIGKMGEDTLFVKDTGIGIAAEDLPRIFEKGYTGKNGRIDKKASGLGLYLCKRICDNLGIMISATSVVDEGTQVTLKFDLNPKVIE